MDYFELECAVENWAEEKGILAKATPMAQSLKTLEETTELITAINNDDREEIIDAMGDIMVTLIIQAKMQNLSLEECLESAYNVITKRTGKMINGQFVKDNYPDVLIADGFDDAIIGIAERYGMNPVVLYNKNKCLNNLPNKNCTTLP